MSDYWPNTLGDCVIGNPQPKRDRQLRNLFYRKPFSKGAFEKDQQWLICNLSIGMSPAP